MLLEANNNRRKVKNCNLYNDNTGPYRGMYQMDEVRGSEITT